MSRRAWTDENHLQNLGRIRTLERERRVVANASCRHAADHRPGGQSSVGLKQVGRLKAFDAVFVIDVARVASGQDYRAIGQEQRVAVIRPRYGIRPSGSESIEIGIGKIGVK